MRAREEWEKISEQEIAHCLRKSSGRKKIHQNVAGNFGNYYLSK